MIRVTTIKRKPLTVEDHVDEACRRALLEAGILDLSPSELATYKRETEKAVNTQLRIAAGPTREQRRRLKQIAEGRLKGPAVSTEARYAASGLVPGSDLKTLAAPGDIK